MQTQSYELEGLAQANAFLTSSNSWFMKTFAHTNVTMNAMQAHLKTLSLTITNPTRTKIKFYCRISGNNFTHGSKTCSDKKTGHKEEAYRKNLLGGSEKRCEWPLGAIINKIVISNPKISLINCIRTPQNYPSNNMLAIADSGANIHLEKFTTTMAPVIISNEMA